MAYLRNSWYAAMWSDELAQQLTSLCMLGNEILMYRIENGEVVALANRCPHRFVELHLGKRVGDRIQCPYHGLQFDRSGACVHNPHGNGFIPESARIRAYPTVERYGLIWLWPGDPQTADADLIPDFSILDQTDDYAIVRGRLEIRADYRLVVDNLMDLSHTEFLHPHFRSSGSSQRTTQSVKREGDCVRAVWIGHDEPMEGLTGVLWEALGGAKGDLAEMTRDMNWHPPSNLFLDLWCARKGATREDGMISSSIHLLMPNTNDRTQYLWALIRNARLDDPEFDEFMSRNIRKAFEEEDAMAIESQQSFVGEANLMDLHPIVLQTDAAAVMARRVLQSLIRRENGEQQRVSAQAIG